MALLADGWLALIDFGMRKSPVAHSTAKHPLWAIFRDVVTGVSDNSSLLGVDCRALHNFKARRRRSLR